MWAETAPVSLPQEWGPVLVESGRGLASWVGKNGSGGAHRGAGLHGGRDQPAVGEAGGPRRGAFPGVLGRGRRPPRRPRSPRGRKPPGAAPLAAAAAMKAVVQRVTRASVTGQSGGAGRSRPDPAPGRPCQGFSRAPPPGDPSPAPRAPPPPLCSRPGRRRRLRWFRRGTRRPSSSAALACSERDGRAPGCPPARPSAGCC